jgi:glycosyltransferase involved in cell wall biosynthesis
MNDTGEAPARKLEPRRGAPDGVSVVLPAFNVGAVVLDTIAALREELASPARALEFIVVDDGSTDRTADIVAGLCQTAPDVRLLRNQRNLGKGVTVYLGVLAARYAHVCFTDADLPFAPGSYARVLGRLVPGHPIVVASRRMPDSEILVRMEVLGYATRRHLVGVIFNQLVRASLRLPFRDTQCGLKAFERQVAIDLLQRIRSPRFLFDIELLVAARHTGVPVDEVPVSIRYQDFKSSVKVVADSTRMFAGLVGIWMRDRLGQYRFPNPALLPERVRGWTEEMGAARDRVALVSAS